MEWLAENLALAYPFSDNVTDAKLASLFADALVVGTPAGPWTLTIFDPQALSNGRVKIMAGATVVYDQVGMTGTALGSYTVLQGTDSTRGSSFRFIVDTAQLALYAFLATPAEFVPQVCVVSTTRVTTLNGLGGDVVVAFDKYISETTENGSVTLAAVDPAKRVECPDLAEVLTINGVAPDKSGSFAIDSDTCYRVMPAGGANLQFMNFCTPCIDTAVVKLINSQLKTQRDYLYQLDAIYQDQFNRYQSIVAMLNSKVASAASRASISMSGAIGGPQLTPDGIVDVSGRSFNRPYFTQLALGIVNSSPYTVSVALSVSVGAVGSYFDPVPESGTINRFLETGKLIDTFTPFPGTLTVELIPREMVSLSSELHLKKVDKTGPQSGQWLVNGTVTFLSGPGTLPSPISISRAYTINILTAQYTQPPPTP